MTKEEKFNAVINYFKEKMPNAKTELNYKNAYQLLVAVILSAQCTDKRVNIITEKLFQEFPDFLSLANASTESIFDFIKSCSYPNNKAKHLHNMAKIVVNEYAGILPKEISELTKLPGVGRKTANVIASIIYNKPTLAVDTHVFRVSQRIGLTNNAKTPLDTEQQLIKYLPDDIIPIAHHWLILHGRYTCVARKPKCETCGISAYCDYYSSNHGN